MKWLLAVAILVLALGLAACGGSSDSGSGSGSSSGAPPDAGGDAATAEDQTSETTDSTEATEDESSATTDSGDSDVDDVIAVTEELENSAIDRDAEKFCALSGATFIARVLAFSGGGNCEEAVGELLAKLPDSQVREDEQQLEELGPAIVHISGDEATVLFKTEKVEYVRANGGWIFEGSHDINP